MALCYFKIDPIAKYQGQYVGATQFSIELRPLSPFDALRWLQSASPDGDLANLVVNPYRLKRLEPRVVKRRPKSHQLITKPREKLEKELDG